MVRACPVQIRFERIRYWSWLCRWAKVQNLYSARSSLLAKYFERQSLTHEIKNRGFLRVHARLRQGPHHRFLAGSVAGNGICTRVLVHP